MHTEWEQKVAEIHVKCVQHVRLRNDGSEMWSVEAIRNLASEERDRKKIKIKADSSTIIMTLGKRNSKEMTEVPRIDHYLL